MDINKRLKIVRESTGASQAKFSALLGMKQQTYANYELSGKIIPDSLKEQLLKSFDIDLNWLVTGQGSMYLSGDSHSIEQRPAMKFDDGLDDAPVIESNSCKSSSDSNVVFIPMTDLKASAGSGEEWGKGDITDATLPVPRNIYDRYKGLAEAFGGVTVHGDSMEPTLKSGEPVVFAKGVIDTDGIYVIAIHDELFVKRLSIDKLDQMVTIISDNKNYPQKSYPLDKEGLSILGKVIFWIHMEG